MYYGKLLNTIEKLEERYVKILEDVCNIESPTNLKKGVDAVGKYFLNMADAKGLKSEIFPQNIAGNVICITLNPDAGLPPVSVSGHIDTVHPVGAFGYPPTKHDKEKIYEPGVMDCKGGVVAAFLAIEALQKCGFTKRPVQLLIQSDEEKGSSISNKATIKYICERAKGSVAFLNVEGHENNIAVIKREGILRYRFTVHGKAAHSSSCMLGINAIAEAANKIIALEKIKEPNSLTCNCGVINGGDIPNTIAEKCVFYADVRFSTYEKLSFIRKKVEEIASFSKLPGCSCDIEEVSYRPPMPLVHKNEELLYKMNEIYIRCNMPVLQGGSGVGGSDAAYITEYGIPCIDGIGTEGGSIHTTDEYIESKSIVESAKRIAAVIYCI